MSITLGNDQRRFTWNSDWAQPPSDIKLGYTHGVIVDREGVVYVFNQSTTPVLKFDPHGQYLGSWAEFPSDRFLGAHGMTYHVEDDQEYLWLTDEKSTEVVKTTLDGEAVLSIAKSPEHPEGVKYSPTWAVQSPLDGTILVADGYGSNLINLYDASGQWQRAWDGRNGLSGKFDCPHALWIGVRPHATCTDQPVLYVADRGNRRVQIFSLPDLQFIKAIPQWYPCAFSQDPTTGDLLVPDLFAAINIYDKADNPLVQHLGDNRIYTGSYWETKVENWPNVPADKIIDGKFNSPHGGTYDHEGNIYIVEWIATGRITKLTRQG